MAGYALFWADLVTGVGMLEPMRVNDAYQRQGSAKAPLTSGLDRLAQLGTRRIKVTFDRYAGRDLQARGAFTTTGRPVCGNPTANSRGCRRRHNNHRNTAPISRSACGRPIPFAGRSIGLRIRPRLRVIKRISGPPDFITGLRLFDASSLQRHRGNSGAFGQDGK